MRTVTPGREQTACEIVLERMPWYANGTLSAAERWAVDAHCDHCPSCAKALELEQIVMGSMRADRGDVADCPQAAWKRFEASLPRAEGVSRERRRFTVFGVIVTAQAAAIAILAVALGIQITTQEAPRYHTLSSSDPTLAIDQPMVRVAFDASVDETQAAQIASRFNGRIVAGPSANNVYTLSVSESEAEALDSLVSRLRREAGVLLAEPIQVGPRS